jgi:hypothetical protein
MNFWDSILARDLILLNLELYTDEELACAVQEGLVTLHEIETQLRMNLVWD